MGIEFTGLDEVAQQQLQSQVESMDSTVDEGAGSLLRPLVRLGLAAIETVPI